MKIKVGSRESKLAVIQSQIVMDSIRRHHPEFELELVTMKTTGDIILDRTLDKIGGKGLFVKELDLALAAGEVDLTVHSFKDMPMETNPALPIVAVSRREDPRDVLILPKGSTGIDLSRPIGCSSARRSIQIKKLYPGCRVEPIRGNVLTRLEKLDSGQFSAIVLAYAGLRRLGLEARISRVFEPWEMLPSACQGILAVQAREGANMAYLEGFHDKEAWDIALAERSFVRTLDGGCSSPVAAYGELRDDQIHLTGLYVAENGTSFWTMSMNDHRSQAETLGKRLAEVIRNGRDRRE
jgi:hydroxymethylbilane synthase